MNAASPLTADLASGKGHRDENFPVASRLVAKRHRAPIMAFYRFARAADDIADHAQAPPETKLARLGAMRATLLGETDADAPALALREVTQAHALDPIHALDLLRAFTRDVTQSRYASWEDLLDYCRYSAMPVGRFVLDVHGESHALWPASDALCTALQIVNHLQDCGKDYRALDRVYLPQDMLAAHAARTEDLGAAQATAALRATIAAAAIATENILARSAGFARSIRSLGLGLEVAVIQRLAVDLAARLKTRDPLADRVHHGKAEALALALPALLKRLVGR